ncbi:MAG: TOBE domain-containing protein, partial [Deltaproteobacteria bacterium]|nr:TOBE domain-containing protein [Deltaproteobacteria bacterium]
MNGKKFDMTPKLPKSRRRQPPSLPEHPSHARIIAADDSRCLDTVQLARLEQSFRQWVKVALRSDVRMSRQRILLIFLLIRYTGAKLKEVLALDPFRDIDHHRQLVVFAKGEGALGRQLREVQIPETLSQEIQAALADPVFKESLSSLFNVDPGHVRRKFYERAGACGFPKELGGPDAIRKSRAVELMQNNLPLPVVQRILGHSTPNLTAAFVSFSDEDIRRVTRFFLEKESRRQTSARNTFFGKISAIQRGDIQAIVELVTIGGDRVTALITNNSLDRLGLKPGMLITAEVKAPWVTLQKAAEEPNCSAENQFQGSIDRINKGKIITEYAVRIADGTELCSLVTS